MCAPVSYGASTCLATQRWSQQSGLVAERNHRFARDSAFFSEELLGVWGGGDMDDMPQYTAGVRRSSAELALQEPPCCGNAEQMYVCKSESACASALSLGGWYCRLVRNRKWVTDSNHVFMPPLLSASLRVSALCRKRAKQHSGNYLHIILDTDIHCLHHLQPWDKHTLVFAFCLLATPKLIVRPLLPPACYLHDNDCASVGCATIHWNVSVALRLWLHCGSQFAWW